MSLLGQNGVPPFGSPMPIDVGYSAVLVGGLSGCSLSQIGQIPTDAASILFRGRIDPTRPPEVTIGGVTLSAVSLYLWAPPSRSRCQFAQTETRARMQKELWRHYEMF